MTINILKSIRDEIAHPKPTEEKIEVSCVDDIWDHLKTGWQKKCTPEFAIHAFEQVYQFELRVLEKEAIAATAFLNRSSCITGH